MNNGIDLVVPWVDGSDPDWLNQKSEYKRKSQSSFQEQKMSRDWGLMRYWFRGVENNLPWVRKIHFITWGHLPNWLNTDHPKLHIVKHEDYMPTEFRPTFSSIPLELNIHRIQGLTEKFIFANDDMFFIEPIAQDYYFDGDLPCDCLHLMPITEGCDHTFGHILWNNIARINRNFTMKDCVKQNKEKWFAPAYSKRILDANQLAYALENFPGFRNEHLPIPLLKSTLEEVWKKEPSLLRYTCRHKFRSIKDVNIWLVRYWQLVSGNFTPRMAQGEYVSVTDTKEKIRDAILSTDNPVICLNEGTDELDFEECSVYIRSLFEIILPEMSSFELY